MTQWKRLLTHVCRSLGLFVKHMHTIFSASHECKLPEGLQMGPGEAEWEYGLRVLRLK